MNWRGSAARFGPSAGLARPRKQARPAGAKSSPNCGFSLPISGNTYSNRPSVGLARPTAVQGHQQSFLKVSLTRSLETLILIDVVSPGKQT